jgi:putative flippase GtrA
MLLALKENGIPFDEVKIRTVYIEENKSSHFRVVRDSWRIYKLILGHFFKYTFSSVLSAVVELALVWLVTVACADKMDEVAVTFTAATVARVLSSLVNFYLNKRLVFHSQVSTGKSLLRYTVLAIVSWLLQTGMVMAIFSVFNIGVEQEGLRTLIHAGCMCVLFVMNYVVQQRWVFTSKKIVKEGK